jgi:hypothetical protein
MIHNAYQMHDATEKVTVAVGCGFQNPGVYVGIPAIC